MFSSVPANWILFNHDLEGIVPTLYADKLGYVSTGMGNEVDPMSRAIGLPWRLPDGNLATRNQIASAWTAVKNDKNAPDGGWKYALKIPGNNIHLMQGDVEALVTTTLETDDRGLAARWHDWEARPACVQLAVHSMVWAMGGNFWYKFPKFRAAFAVGDYVTCGAECAIAIPIDPETEKPIGGTIVTRNARNKKLFAYAASIAGDASVDPSVLTSDMWNEAA